MGTLEIINRYSVKVGRVDAVVVLGLRYFSRVKPFVFQSLRNSFSGPICQFHDGTRMDLGPVDVTFTFKDSTSEVPPNKMHRHVGRNVCVGWAADCTVFRPMQSLTTLKVLIDHRNYGGGTDHSDKVVP